MPTSKAVLDASAVLALLGAEPGAEVVGDAVVAGAAISAVNLSETVAKLADAGVPQAAVHQVLDALALEIVDFTAELAYAAGHLRRSTRSAGLALGDRACLALGQQVGLPVLTSDRRWSDVSLGVEVRQIR